MQLNEIIEEYSIATISKKTRISIVNIEKLVNRDFSGMKKVKALGFISILEREFDADLDGLRKECQEFFYSVPDEEFDARLVVTIPESDDRSSSWLGKFLMAIVIIFVLVAGAWFYLTSDQNMGDSQLANETSLIGSIVNQAQELMGSSKQTVETPMDNLDGVWAKKDNNDSPDADSSADTTRPSKDESLNEQNDSSYEEQVIREVKQEQKKLLAAQDKSKSDDSNTTIESIMEQDATESAGEQEALAVEVPSMTGKTDKDQITEAGNNTKKADSVIASIVTFVPSKKVWVGYTDLATMKRSAKVVEEEIDFDASGKGWILVAGHNAIKFVIDGEEIVPEGKGKKYFLIKDGKVESIPKEEFQKLNKSTVW